MSGQNNRYAKWASTENTAPQPSISNAEELMIGMLRSRTKNQLAEIIREGDKEKLRQHNIDPSDPKKGEEQLFQLLMKEAAETGLLDKIIDKYNSLNSFDASTKSISKKA